MHTEILSSQRKDYTTNKALKRIMAERGIEISDMRKTVFLVDDEMINLKVGKNALSDAYNVFASESGESMLELINNVSPDLILLDVKMPGMDGYEVIRHLKANKNTADIPVIFLTSLNDEETEIKGLSAGAVDYIIKPFSAPSLLKRIEIHLLIESQKQKLLSQKTELQHLNNNLHQMVEDKTQTVTELKDAILSTMAELVEYRDEGTGGHIARTQSYVEILLRGMKEHGVYEAELEAVDESLALQSCQLHDIGKIAISDAILLKPGKLTPEEFEKIKEHTVFGEKVILKLKDKTIDSDFAEYARVFAISHHEKWNGCGYPRGLKGEEIPLLGRIMAIADVYDALVELRPYKAPYTHDEAVRIILEGKGNHFDPTLVDLFEKINVEFEKTARRLNVV